MALQETSTPSRIMRFIEFPLTRIIIAILFFVVASFLSKIILLPFNDLLSDKNIEIAIRTSVSILCFLLAYIAFVKLIEKRKITELSHEYFFRDSLSGILAISIMVAVVYGYLILGGYLRVESRNPVSFMIIPFFASLSAGIIEEIIFRGVFYRIIEEKLGTYIALIITAIFFGLIHLMNKNATIEGALSIVATAGFLLALAFTLTKRLWLPISMHFTWNFLTGGVFATIVSGNAQGKGLFNTTLSGPEVITGGVFGPEASLITVICGVSLAGIFFYLVKRKGVIVKPFWKNKFTSIS
jgi:uncharacterized protein